MGDGIQVGMRFLGEFQDSRDRSPVFTFQVMDEAEPFLYLVKPFWVEFDFLQVQVQ